MIFSMSEDKYIRLIKELVRVLKPGGYVSIIICIYAQKPSKYKVDTNRIPINLTRYIELKEISIEQITDRAGVYTKTLMKQCKL